MAKASGLLKAGQAAIDRAAWALAEELFGQATALEETPESLDGLATALGSDGPSAGPSTQVGGV